MYSIDENKKILDNNTGAASVLIIFMMIILVTLGMFTLVSANVNIKFAKKNVASNVNFYKLDSLGDKFVCDVCNSVRQSESVLEGLSNLRQKYPGIIITHHYDDNNLVSLTDTADSVDVSDSVEINVSLKLEENAQSSLNVSLRLNPYESGDDFLNLLAWNQVNTPFNYQNEDNLWNGKVD